MKKNKILFLVLVVGAVGAGVYFSDKIGKVYESSSVQIENKISEFQKISAPAPLQVLRRATQSQLSSDNVILQTNLQRKENGGLPALTENDKLDQAALAKANDMFAKQYFEHVSLSGVGPAELAKSYGYDYIVEGENLILGSFGSEKEMVQDWMNSPGHRANILNNRYTEIGVAVVQGKYKGEQVWIGVQEFGLPLTSCPQVSLALKTQIDDNQNKLNSMTTQINQLQSQINSADKTSSQYNNLVDQYNQLVAQYNPLANEAKTLVAQYNQQINDFNNCISGTK